MGLIYLVIPLVEADKVDNLYVLDNDRSKW